MMKDDRQELFLLFRNILYAESEEEFRLAEEAMKTHECYLRYPKYQKYLEKVLTRKNEWSMEFRLRECLATGNINTTNFAEVSFRLTKDLKFNRHRAHNLLDFLSIVMDKSSYYQMRCVDAANNTLTSRLKNQKSAYLPSSSSIDPSQIVQIDADNFLVPSESKVDKFYDVNI